MHFFAAIDLTMHFVFVSEILTLKMTPKEGKATTSTMHFVFISNTLNKKGPLRYRNHSKPFSPEPMCSAPYILTVRRIDQMNPRPLFVRRTPSASIRSLNFLMFTGRWFPPSQYIA